jgi:hypothetical protein
MPSPYKRSGSGYSETDEAGAKRYGEQNRILYQDLANRRAAGEKGISKSADNAQALSARKQAEENYKRRLSTPEGREINEENVKFLQGDVNQVLETNSRAQYEHEREAGDPNALKLSFSEWKKL